MFRWVTTADRNINWTYGLGGRPVRMSARLYVPLLFAGFVLVVFVPTDLILRSTAWAR